MVKILFLLVLLVQPLTAAPFVRLEGYLSKERLEPLHNALKVHNDEIVISLDSNGGDLNALLTAAKEIYEKKTVDGMKVTLYIDDQALGPAALLPLLADKLYSSPFVSWGDIPLGNEKALPTNILRSQAVNLIPQGAPRYNLLVLLAAAMSDPTTIVVEKNGEWIEGEKEEGKVISKASETLVVSQNQLKQLGLVAETMAPAAFDARFGSSMTQEEVKEALAVTPREFEERLRKAIKPRADGKNTVGHLLIDDKSSGISQSTWLYVKSALDSYKAMNLPPLFLILELNTPGGEVFAAQQISDALKELDVNNSIPVVAFINNWAISAGAMLAYSSRFITVVKDGSMGAAEPVLQGEGGEMKPASEKVNSALRTDFANRARFFDRNPDIAEAMVDKDLILVLRNGKVMKLSSADQIKSEGPNPDIVISPKDKLLTLNAQQLVDYGVADAMFSPMRLEPISSAEQAKGEWPLSKTLVGQLPFFKELPNATVHSYRPDWRTQFFIFLATPLVSSLLMLGLLVGLYLEFSTPGFGLPGTVATLCLMLIIISNLSLEIASWLELVFLAAGVLIILADLFLLPTGGIFLFVGVIIALGSLFAMMLPAIGSINYEVDTHSLNGAGELFLKRLAWLSGTIVVAAVIIAFLTRYIKPTFRGLRRFVLLGHEQDASEGFIAGDDPRKLPQPGARGEVFATLRPSGKVLIEGTIYEAVTMGGYIAKGEKIVVESLDGSVIVVDRAENREEQVPW